MWGIAQFGDALRHVNSVDALGVTTRAASTSVPASFDDLPTDFTYLLHLVAAFLSAGTDYEQALRVNAEGTGLLLQHLPQREGGAGLSTADGPASRILGPAPRVDRERDPVGDADAAAAPPTYSDLQDRRGGRGPLLRAMPSGCRSIIALMDAAYGSYGERGGLPGIWHLLA